MYNSISGNVDRSTVNIASSAVTHCGPKKNSIFISLVVRYNTTTVQKLSVTVCARVLTRLPQIISRDL